MDTTEVAKQLPMDSRSEDYSGGDALGGNTRTPVSYTHLGSAVCDVLCEEAPTKVLKIGVNDVFGESCLLYTSRCV